MISQEKYQNVTPEAARLAGIDYKWNGARARCKSGEFLMPRWVPDEEVAYCQTCRSEFDWVNRKHHCRHCGHVFCGSCTHQSCLLPDEFGLRDPQRVCAECHRLLLPQQAFLTNSIAHHQRLIHVDIASSNCSARRYCNFPVSMTMTSEIRKASYAVHNLVGLKYIKDKALPISLISHCKGIAFLTIAKGGYVIGGRLGTGLVIAKCPNGQWSAPTAIGTAGVSWGALLGFEVVDYMIILNTDEAVTTFSGCGQLAIGAGIDVALGPLGR